MPEYTVPEGSIRSKSGIDMKRMESLYKYSRSYNMTPRLAGVKLRSADRTAPYTLVNNLFCTNLIVLGDTLILDPNTKAPLSSASAPA